MAVLAVWQCDRDGAMFQDKKAAEEYDKMLELAENISVLVERHVGGLSHEQGEAIGLLLAGRRELLVKACKGKPEALLEEPSDEEVSDSETSLKAEPAQGKVTAIAAQK